MSNGAPPNPALEAFKLEYQLAATRYENIYKALWQIFSYLSAVTAAILTFGGDRFQPNLLWVLASLPLIFWYFSTFLPLDRYGNRCLDRLVGIEADINGLAGSSIKHYTNFKESRPPRFISNVRRARFSVSVFAIALILVFVWNTYAVIRASNHHEPLILRKSADKPISLTADELKMLMQPSPAPAQTPRAANPPEHSGKNK